MLWKSSPAFWRPVFVILLYIVAVAPPGHYYFNFMARIDERVFYKYVTHSN